MASTVEAQRLTELHRVEQARVSQMTALLMLRLFGVLDPQRPEETSERWLALVIPLLRRQRELSARLAARYIVAFRRIELPDALDDFIPDPRTELPLGKVIPSLMVTGPVELRRILREKERALREAKPIPESEADWLATLQPSDIEKAAAKAAGAAIRHAREGERETLYAAAKADPRALGYMRVSDGDPCYFCAMLVSRGPVYREDSFADSDPRFHGEGEHKVHDSCVVGGTVVSGPAVEVGYRRRYEGEGVVLRTASGNELTITPNHPVLTPQGWVPAGLVCEGDDLLSAFDDQSGLLAVPDQYQQPALIADLFAALSVMYGARRRGVPVAAEEFHGDGSDSEVDIVSVDRFLADGIFSELAQPGIEESLALAGAAGPAVAFASLGTQEHLVMGGDSASSGFMRPCGHPLAVFGSSLGVDEEAGLPGASRLDSILEQAPTYYASADPDLFGQVFLGSPGEVAVDHPGWDDPSRRPDARPKFDPTGTEFAADGGIRYAELGRALADRLAGHVRSDRVLEARRISLSGHVYNLQTSEGWYAANGIIASNCGCTVEPVYSRAQKPDALQSYANDLWKTASTDRGGRDAVKAFRQLYEGRDVTP